RGEHGMLARRPLSQLAVEFLCDLAEHRTCQEWAEGVLAGDATDADGQRGDGRRRGQADEVARATAVKILSRLRVPAHTDLRGAAVEGSHWQRAALIDAAADPATLDTPELRSAAIAPGMPVEPAFRPAAVGVPYGFDMRTSRLPEPISYSPDGELLAVGSE